MAAAQSFPALFSSRMVTIRTELPSELPEIPPNNAAASRIQKGWRQSNIGLSILQNYRTQLVRLPHQKFQHVWRSSLKPLLEMGTANKRRFEKVQHEVRELKELRLKYQKRLCIPLCTSVSRQCAPRFRMIAKEQIDPSYRRVGHCFLTPKAYAQHMKIPKYTLKSKADLDDFVSTMSQLSELFIRQYKVDGCGPKASLMCDILAIAGISRKYIAKQVARVPKHLRAKGPASQWSYHIAPLIKLANGTSWVLEPEKALSLKDWIARQIKPLSPNDTSSRLVDKGVIRPNAAGQADVNFPDDHCLTFTTGADMHVKDINENQRKIHLDMNGDYVTASLKMLTDQRLLLEQAWLSRFS